MGKSEIDEKLWRCFYFLFQQRRRDSEVSGLRVRPHLNHTGSYFSLPHAVLTPPLPPPAEVRNLPKRGIKWETEGLRKASQSGSAEQSWKHTLSASRVWIWFMTFITWGTTDIWIWLVLVPNKKGESFLRDKNLREKYFSEWTSKDCGKSLARSRNHHQI